MSWEVAWGEGETLGEAEVDEVEGVLAGVQAEDDVVGLEVEVEEALGVHVGQGFYQLIRNEQNRLQTKAKSTFLKVTKQRRPQQLHHLPLPPILLPIPQQSRKVCLPLTASPHVSKHIGLISQQGTAVGGGQQLHCDFGVGVQVGGFEDAARAPDSQTFGVELVAGCKH